MIKFLRRSLVLLLPVVLIACQTGKKLYSTCELTSISQVEGYLNDPKGFEGKFTQTWADGGHSTGRIVYVPGKLRLNYETPGAMIVVAKGTRMVAKRFDDQSVTHIGLSKNPLGLMLNSPVHLVNPILVTAVQHGTNALQISLASADNPSQGLLTLRFQEHDGQLTLDQMQAVDVRNRRSIMELSDVTPGVTVPDSYFLYPDQSEK